VRAGPALLRVHREEGLFGAPRRSSVFVNRQKPFQHYLTMLILTAPAAAIVWFVFHGVYETLSISVKAVGYVYPMTQMGITLGYCVMIGGTVVLGGIAAWSAFQLLRLLFARRR
jgi:hypothetical protein